MCAEIRGRNSSRRRACNRESTGGNRPRSYRSGFIAEQEHQHRILALTRGSRRTDARIVRYVIGVLFDRAGRAQCHKSFPLTNVNSAFLAQERRTSQLIQAKAYHLYGTPKRWSTGRNHRANGEVYRNGSNPRMVSHSSKYFLVKARLFAHAEFEKVGYPVIQDLTPF